MYNSKLYSILEHFDKYEQNRCRKYIQSPYFNKAQELIDLYEIFIKRINSTSNKAFTKESIWKKLINDKPFDDVRFRKFCSDLLKLVEGYLSQISFENNPLHQAPILIKAVGERGLEKLYNSTMKTARRLSNQQPYKSGYYYFYQYEIEKNYYELSQAESKRTDRTNVEEIIKNLDYFYLSEKLKWLCAVLSRQYLVSHEYELLFIDEIVNHINNYNFENIPSISIYYQIYLTQSEASNLTNYYKLKILLAKYSLEFPKSEAYTMYSYALNYCIRQLNSGNREFVSEAFDLYNDLLDKGIIFINEELSPWAFKNIVVIALRNGKYKWTENFIHKYSNKLPENSRDNAVTFNLARLYWYQKQHDKVIELLREVEYDDIAYNLSSKSMLIATYYETDEIDPLYFLLESFRVYLNRHKDIPESRRRNYKNLIKYTKRLTKIRPGDKTGLKKLKEEIEGSKNIADAKWLLEKIAELE